MRPFSFLWVNVYAALRWGVIPLKISPMTDKDEKTGGIFSEMKAMILSSLGRIPAALVIIFVVAVTLSLLAGLFLKVSSREKPEQVFMPLRLEASENAPHISLKRLQGQWVSQSPDYAMSFTFIGDRFEWIMRFADLKEAQFYARGNFRIDGDVLVIGQRPDLGQPYDPEQPWLKYIPMAMRDLNARISIDGANLVWSVPTSEQKKIISYPASIFNKNKDGKFVWVKR